MGDHADDALNRYYMSLALEEGLDRKTYWYQKDGTPIRYVDMKEGHLKNSIAMMERNKDPEELGISMTYMMLCNELNRRKRLHEQRDKEESDARKDAQQRAEILAEQRRRQSPEWRIQQLEEQVETLKSMLVIALDELNLDNQSHQVNYLDRLGPR